MLRDLTRYSVLREAGYRYVITHSPDERGINVALLYQRGIFKLLSNRSYPVMKPRRNSRPTRDILHVSGQLLNSDTLDVFVVHFRPGPAGQSVRTVPPGSSTKIERHNRQPAPDPHPPPNHHYGRFQRLSRQQIHTENTESRNTAHRNGLFRFPDALPSLARKALTTSISAATNIRGNGDCSTISFFPAAC